MSDNLNEKILGFLQQKSLESPKKVDSVELIQQLHISEIQLKARFQSLKDQKFIEILNRTGYSSLVNITSEGRIFLNSAERSPKQSTSNGPTFVFNGPIESIGTVGTSYGVTNLTDNRVTKIVNELENVKSIVRTQETNPETLAIILEKISQLQHEHKQTQPSQTKINSILTHISSVASWLTPIISSILITG